MNISAEILKEKILFFLKVESARIQISSQKPREDKLNTCQKLFLNFSLCRTTWCLLQKYKCSIWLLQIWLKPRGFFLKTIFFKTQNKDQIQILPLFLFLLFFLFFFFLHIM